MSPVKHQPKELLVESLGIPWIKDPAPLFYVEILHQK
jgi:hypothetical protein